MGLLCDDILKNKFAETPVYVSLEFIDNVYELLSVGKRKNVRIVIKVMRIELLRGFELFCLYCFNEIFYTSSEVILFETS